MEVFRPPDPKNGFTLIESIAMVSVSAILIALLLPALGNIRGSAYSVLCSSNQRQMIQGWHATMIGNMDQIPRTISPYDPIDKPWDDWSILLYESMGGVGQANLDGSANTGHMACPHIEVRFSGPAYMTIYYGYAINSRMRPGMEYGDNEGKRWSSIVSPANYPWFTDPFIINNETATVGKSYFGAVSLNNWGVGLYHGYESGSVAYADGHVAKITESVLQGPADEMSAPLWLLDTP